MQVPAIIARKLLLVPVFLLSAGIASPVFSQTVLKRGDIEVTVQDIQRYVLVNTPEAQRQQLLQRPGIVREMAENLYIIRQLSATAKASDDLDHELINWAIELDAGRRRMEAILIQQVDATLEAANWDAAAQEVYARDGEKFVRPEQARAAHILVSTENRSDDEALQIIEKITERLDAGENFAAVAREVSDDPSAARNRGDLGYFGRGSMVPEFEEVVFAMRTPGEVSKPVKSQFGYHLIQFKDYREGGKAPFEEVRPQIVAELERQTRQKLRQDQIVAIRSVPDIEWNEDLLTELTEKLGGRDRVAPRTPNPAVQEGR